MKTCFKCKKEKPLSLFYRHKQMADGRLNKCIECAKADAIRHRNDNLEKVRAYDRARGSLKHRVESNNARIKVYRAKFPLKYRANNAVNNAVRDGRLLKPTECPVCGSTRQIEGHHDDYKKPLDVVWLCSSCHSRLHADSHSTL